MSNENKVRLAHELLDEINARRDLTQEQTEVLRSFLPELPKQKTLEEITERVRDAWVGASGNGWAGNSYNTEITLESWLGELYVQLKGLRDTPAAVPALPAGMRLADHEEYGRVVTSPKPDQDGVYVILIPKPKVETGADWGYAHECELTFIDASHAAPAHPEFLETEADYQNAPDTQVIRTPEELEALDPDTVFMNTWGDLFDANNVHAGINTDDFPYYFPCSVVASGGQVRAAREAMEQDNE